MHIKKTYYLGPVIEVSKYYPGNYGAPGRKRRPKRKRTPEDIARQNQINRERNLQRLILANFGEGDWHLVLTEKKEGRSGSVKEAKERVRGFLKDMRKAFQKAGKRFKYIYVTEKGKRGSFHHHLIIEDIAEPDLNTKKLVMKFWKHGSRYFYPLYEDGEFEDLAEYLVKKETKEENDGCTYSHSRNLIIPKPKKKVIHSRRWRKEPKAPGGWYIVKDSIVNGENPVTGYPYQRYFMKKLDPGGTA